MLLCLAGICNTYAFDYNKFLIVTVQYPSTVLYVSLK